MHNLYKKHNKKNKATSPFIVCGLAPESEKKHSKTFNSSRILARREGYGGNQLEWTGDEFTSEIAGGRTSRFIRSRPAEPLNERPFRPGGVLSNQTSRKFECTLSYLLPPFRLPSSFFRFAVSSYYVLKRRSKSATRGDTLDAHLILVVVVDVVVSQTKDLMHF